MPASYRGQRPDAIRSQDGPAAQGSDRTYSYVGSSTLLPLSKKGTYLSMTGRGDV